MIKKLSLAAFLLTAITNAQAINFEEAVNKAIEHSNEYKSGIEQYKSLQTRKVKAYLGVMPSVNAAVSRTHQSLKRDDASTSVTGTNDSKSVQVRQNLFNGGATYFGIKQATHLEKQGDANLSQVLSGVIYNSAAAYIELLLSLEMKKYLDVQEETLQQFYDSTEIRFTLGEVTATDVAQAKARLSSAQAEKAKGYGRLGNAKVSFAKLTGQKPDNLEPIKFEIKMPESLEEAKRIARDNNKKLMIANHNIEIAKQNVNLAVSKLMPTLDVIGSVSRASGSTIFSSQNGLDKAVSLQVNIPIFNQGVEYATIFDYEHQKSSSKYNYSKALEDMLESVDQVWNGYNISLIQIKSAEDAVKSAQLAFDGTQEEVKIGLKTNLDVLNAEQDLYNLKVQLLNSRYQKILYALQMYNLVGKLDKDFLVLLSRVK